MRRRVVDVPGAMPPHLRRYNAADWPNPACHPECAFWDAVAQWREEHLLTEDGPLELVDGPDAPWHPEWI